MDRVETKGPRFRDSIELRYPSISRAIGLLAGRAPAVNRKSYRGRSGSSHGGYSSPLPRSYKFAPNSDSNLDGRRDTRDNDIDFDATGEHFTGERAETLLT